MKVNVCTIHSVLLPSSNFFPKNSSWVGLDKFGFLGGGVATQLEDITSFRGTKKKGWNIGRRCAIVYAHGDFPFKVLLIAVDGL